jgi:galactose mutarotase-like enzyme
MARIRIASPALTAEVDPAGAELSLLRDASGQDFLWDAGPAWPRHSPVLFPIVGKLADDAYRHARRTYPLRQHGFARDRAFTLTDHAESRCSFRLEDDAATRAIYPFRFALEIHYAVEDARLRVDYRLTNPGDGTLPASLGAHPAFRWPLPGSDGAPHAILFEAPEPAPVRRLAQGLLRTRPEPSPVQGRRLDLKEDLFTADALILDGVASRSLDYGPPGGPCVRFAFHGFDVLGLWSKPGAGFLCIEPWSGFHSPEDWEGEFADKPGMLAIPPGGCFQAGWTVDLAPA